MKQHTSGFKQNLIDLGRDVDNIVTYDNTTLHNELFSASVVYEGNVLKSVMKELDIESSVDIPKETIINYKMGIKVGNAYEYLDYGNFVVFSSERQEDKRNYKIVAYDKMLYSMKDYEDLEVQYPITIRDYITALCNKLDLEFANEDDEFANYDRQILTERYLDADGNSLDYTYRDVLDELAQVTASTICINKDDKLEIRYIQDIPQSNNTDYIIGETQLKDINVDFGEKYGPINTIVLSRSAGSDNVYIQDEESVAENGIHEIRIKDNQIMNGNDRSDYLPDILEKLDGLEYYINDYSSTGICYLDLCDSYKIQAHGNEYKCIMFNDEINVNQGIEENVHTDMPEEAETDYSKADKTDRRLNQTTLIVDKQNQQIQSLVAQIGDRSEKTTSITQDIDSIELKIEDLEDLTVEVQGENPIQLDNCLEGELITLRIIGNNTVFKPLVPLNTLYPSETLYPKGSSILRFYTHNVCPDKEANWHNKYNDNTTLVSSFVIPTKNQKTCISIENSNYKIVGLGALDVTETAVTPIAVTDPQTNIIDWSNQEYASFEIYIQKDDETEIKPVDILEAKPMVTYSNEKLAYVKYNTYEIDLGIEEELRQLNASVYDEVYYNADYLYDLEEDEDEEEKNKCVLIRRVGVNGQGQLYELAEPTYQVLDIPDLLVVQGTNYIDIIEDYTATLYAKYVQINDFTKLFATQYQVTSQILQLSNQILLLVQEKVGNNEVVAKINLAVQEGQGIIDILGNQIKIKSDNFELTADGHIIAKAGTIAGWNITPTRLYKSKSGIVSTNEPKGLVFYAGADENTISNSKFRVLNNGEVTAHLLHIEADVAGHTGIHIYDENQSLQMTQDTSGISFYEDGALYGRIGQGSKQGTSGKQALAVGLNQANIFSLIDMTTGDNLLNINDTNAIDMILNSKMPNFRVIYKGEGTSLKGAIIVHRDGDNQATTTIYNRLEVLAQTNVIKNYDIDDSTAITTIDFQNNKIYFYLRNGAQYTVNISSSDKTFKKNIKSTEIKSAVDLIDKIKHYSFDWKGSNEHQKIGYIANELYEIDDCLADKVPQGENAKQKELYQFNTNNILALCTKAIQELNTENKQLKEKIDELEKRLSKLEGGK